MWFMFPPAERAEDQRFARTVLYTQCITECSMFTCMTYALVQIIGDSKRNQFALGRALSQSFTAGVVVMPITAVLLTGFMWGKEEIALKERSWKELHDKGGMAAARWQQTCGVLGGIWGAQGHLPGPSGLRGLARGAAGGCFVGLIPAGFVSTWYLIKGWNADSKDEKTQSDI